MFIYKPIYSVSLNEEFLGYCANKAKLQTRINEYVANGEEDQIAYVQIDELPDYKMCLLKKGIVTDDEGIFEAVKQTGTPYYKYYAVAEDGEEKAYLANYEEAVSVIDELKTKNSTNQNNIGIVEKYGTSLDEFTEVEAIVASLYKEPVKSVAIAKATTARSSGGGASKEMSSEKASIGISLIKPVSRNNFI